jgi:UV DNA damage endonuclease
MPKIYFDFIEKFTNLASGLSVTPWAKINIHINTTQGGKQECTDRFCQNFELLDKNTKARLVVENDDKASQYSVKDLFEMVHKRIGIPITFDVHHHKFCNSGLDHQTAVNILISLIYPEYIGVIDIGYGSQ